MQVFKYFAEGQLWYAFIVSEEEIETRSVPIDRPNWWPSRGSGGGRVQSALSDHLGLRGEEDSQDESHG